MSIEDRFNAAVNVIRGLPKNGPYQPSNDMLLRFYSYFKQATKGKCCERRPGFWDVINRAKWDAWNRLGDMPKEVAMQRYVDELKKIVETMSYTDNVANFMEYSMSDLDNVNISDLEMVAPEAIKKVRSRPNSPFASREASPGRLSPATPSPPPMMPAHTVPMVNGHVHKPTAINGYHSHSQHSQSNHTHHPVEIGVNLVTISNGASSGPSELSDDEYIDTYDDDFESETANSFRPIEAVNHARLYQNGTTSAAGGGVSLANGGVGMFQNGSNGQINAEVAAQITRTIERLNASVQQVNSRVSMIEQSMTALRDQQQQQFAKLSASADRYSSHRRAAHPAWWPFAEVSPAMVAFIILWPLVINRITSWAQRKKP
ncbi:acyl-CoA-binding domain-containing protein 5 [Anopheles ziemanni]|uniref:acyl-CoA-binding domain-containing protein 5 n=1 Tax=Anopheles coustani TaxID=139045 RepID=UPI00265A7473|nr:acyl-CoA-binding domain-containing protein 5 [Anopheles coustani]XP_058171552.1 acyl-CoA-binding domain-containing protein 5 [Anopheles ziemanni]